MRETHHHRSFADGRRHSVHGTRAEVARGKRVRGMRPNKTYIVAGLLAMAIGTLPFLTALLVS